MPLRGGIRRRRCSQTRRARSDRGAADVPGSGSMRTEPSHLAPTPLPHTVPSSHGVGSPGKSRAPGQESPRDARQIVLAEIARSRTRSARSCPIPLQALQVRHGGPRLADVPALPELPVEWRVVLESPVLDLALRRQALADAQRGVGSGIGQSTPG